MDKTFTYKIKPVKRFGEEELVDTGFKGEITVSIPDYMTRMKLVKEQSALGDDFEKISESAMNVCGKYISQIKLTHDDVDGEITTLDDLSIFEEGVAVIFDIYNQILKGWSLSPKRVKA